MIICKVWSNTRNHILTEQANAIVICHHQSRMGEGILIRASSLTHLAIIIIITKPTLNSPLSGTTESCVVPFLLVGQMLTMRLLLGVLNWSSSIRSCNGITVICRDLNGVADEGVASAVRPWEAKVSSCGTNHKNDTNWRVMN